jgi:hypothetical protein
MSYQIKLLEDTVTLKEVQAALDIELEESRFTVEEITCEQPGPRTKYIGGYITLRNIRLKELKPYCGNHPGPCLINKKHRQSRCLEGLDWVEFNDLVNNVLDSLYLSADVLSSQCVMRLGHQRRTHYGMKQQGRFATWDIKGHPNDYEDYRGKKAPKSGYPNGTPGLLSA